MNERICLYRCPTCNLEFWAPERPYMKHQVPLDFDDIRRPPSELYIKEHLMELVAYALY